VFGAAASPDTRFCFVGRAPGIIFHASDNQVLLPVLVHVSKGHAYFRS
jgi:hypothetical protein